MFVYAASVSARAGRLHLDLPWSPLTLNERRVSSRVGETRGRIRDDGWEDVSNLPTDDGLADKNEEELVKKKVREDGNRGERRFFDGRLPLQVVLHPFIRGRFLRNLLKEPHAALLSLTTRGPY